MSSETGASGIGARLDRMPVGRFHRRLAWAIGAGLLVDGFDVYLTSGVAGALVKHGMADLSDVAKLVATTFVGLGLGGYVSGWLADRVGRRRTLRWTLAIVIVGSLGAAVAPTVPALLAWRFFTALGLGGETVLGYAMLTEFLPPASRGRWLARLGLLANLGMPLALMVGYFVLPYEQGWRWMLAIPAFAALPVLYLRRSLVESPRWLASQGRLEEARRVVTNMEGGEAAAMASVPVRAEAQAGGGGHGAVRHETMRRGLFVPGNVRLLTVGAAVNVAVMGAVFGFVSWLPTFFASEGRDIAASVLFAGLMSLGSPLGVLLGMAVIDRVERKWGLVACSVLVGILGAGYAMAESVPGIVSMGFLVVTMIYMAGTLGMTSYVPELFPTELRMRSVGFCATVGRAFAVGMPFLVVPVFTATGQAGVVGLVVSILLVQAVVVALLGPRTNARPLEAVK